MRLSQQCAVLLFVYWISLHLNHLWIQFLFFVLCWVYFRHNISWKYFVCLMLVLIVSTQSKPHVDPNLTSFCGTITQFNEDYKLIRNGRQHVTVFYHADVWYDQHVCVEGSLVQTTPRHNFFIDPIESWRVVNHHLGVMRVSSYQIMQRPLSFKAKLYEYLTQQEHTEWIIHLLYQKNMKIHHSFSLIFVFTGLQYVYGLQLIRKLLRKFFYESVTNGLILIFWLVFGMVWGISFVWTRVLLSSVLLKFAKDKQLAYAISYGVLLVLYPLSYTQLALVFPMVLHGFMLFVRSSWLKRSLLVGLLQQTYLYQSNLVMIVAFPLFRHLSGLSYLMAWVAIIFVPLRAIYQTIMETITTVDFPLMSSFFVNFKLPLLLFFILCGLLLTTYLSQTKKRLLGYVIAVCFMIITVFPPYDLVVFFNVGQADAALIRGRFNRANVMIDVGRKSSGSLLIASLKALGIQSLDAVFISHPHDDHNGGLEDILLHFNTNEIIETRVDRNFNHVVIFALTKDYVSNDVNDQSLIHAVYVSGLTYLFLGDVYQSAEREVVRQHPFLDVDIIKIAHHGSKTSSLPFLFAQTQPRIAIISSDPNVYGHPHNQTLKTLYDHQVIPWMTHQDGDLAIISMFNYHFLLSSTGRFGIMKSVIP
jgi:competence protein ComEC